MLIFEITIILLFILFVYLSFKFGDDLPLYPVIAFLLFICILGGLFTNDTTNEQTPIVSLERGQSIEGRFVLGIGQVESKNVYFAYQNVGDNKYKLVTLPDVIITETNEHIPAYVKTIKCKRPYIFIRCEELENTIYVPVGTIKKQFNL